MDLRSYFVCTYILYYSLHTYAHMYIRIESPFTHRLKINKYLNLMQNRHILKSEREIKIIVCIPPFLYKLLVNGLIEILSIPSISFENFMHIIYCI